MEHADSHFIWAGWAPEDYIIAFRRMIDVCREVAPRVNVVWSPLGEAGLEAYYPGDPYVDLVGITVFGFQAYEERTQGRALHYEEVLRPRYDRAAVFGKPVLVTELGYTGDAAYVADWGAEVSVARPEMPALLGAVYFNQEEVYAWPGGDDLPDWRINERVTSEGGAETFR
jgi:endoglucanase